MLRSTARLLLALLLVAGCGGDGDDDVATTTSTGDTASSTTSTTSAEPVGEPATGEVRSPGFPDSSGETAMLVDVRVAAHRGFERIVLELEAEEAPSYRVRYVEPPVREDGSGREVDVAGDAFLELRLVPASGVDLGGSEPRQTYRGPSRIDAPAEGPVLELVQVGDFEAHLSWVAGLSERRPFGVAVLSEPVRLVVDVVAAG